MVLAQVLQKTLRDGLDDNTFWAGAAGVVRMFGEQSERVECYVGHTRVQGEPVSAHTFFDLASLTKPVLVMAVLRAVEQGHIDLAQTLTQANLCARDHAAANVTLEELLSHRSGLLAWSDLYRRVPFAVGSHEAKEWMINEALLSFDPQQRGRAVYSDLGFLIAGFWVEKVVGQPLDALIKHQITIPLAIENGFGFAAKESFASRQCVAATEYCLWRQRLLIGEVHDENCAAWGGVAGHAGLFATLPAVMHFAADVLRSATGRAGLVSAHAMQNALARRPQGDFRLGWDGKAESRSSAGSKMSASTFGHLGFTGTSLWIDPERAYAVVLLTNRVYPTRSNDRIRVFRPRFHDAIADALDA